MSYITRMANFGIAMCLLSLAWGHIADAGPFTVEKDKEGVINATMVGVRIQEKKNYRMVLFRLINIL